MILLHSLSTLDTEAKQILVGHTLSVCTLSYASLSRKLVSGSWDCTARVWAENDGQWETELVLEGYEEAVWGVAAVEAGPSKGCFLTGKSAR